MNADWRIGQQPPEQSALLAREAGVPPLVARLLASRGVSTAEQARVFLHPDISRLHDPLSLRGAEEAAEILVTNARAGRRVVVFGDYDVDGLTAAAQLCASLRLAGADAVAFIPHRLRDGYGLKPRTVRFVLENLRPSVLVTVDCGISAVEGVACAREAGVEVVVTDHHIVPDELPTGAVVVNPKQPGCPYPCKDLSASGIALKISEAVARGAGRRLSQESLLRLACLGTIADLVPLTGENRVIAAAGLSALASPRAPGLKALLAECGVPAGRGPTAEEVAFRLAPRLNAAGRVDAAEVALSLFEQRDAWRAAQIARRLSRVNAERQLLERRVTEEARARIHREGTAHSCAVLIEADQAWHPGVLGIAASRLAREYHRPVLLFALEGAEARGSGRSVPGVSLYEILKEISESFTEFGGHDQAVGGSLPARRFAEFRDRARDHFARRLPPERLRPLAEAEEELPLGRLTEELLFHLERLEPHGMGNPRPVFFCDRVRASGRPLPLGERGLRGRLRGEDGEISFVCWDSEVLPRLDGAACQIQYRFFRNRHGFPEVEILRARESPVSSDSPE